MWVTVILSFLALLHLLRYLKLKPFVGIPPLIKDPQLVSLNPYTMSHPGGEENFRSA